MATYKFNTWLKLGLLPMALYTGAASAASLCDAPGKSQTAVIGDGSYNVQTNYWNASSGGAQCVDVNTSTGQWKLTSAGWVPPNGAPSGYPSIYKGCHWGTCTKNSGLPLQLSSIGSAPSSWDTTPGSNGQWDIAYDIWFSQGPTAPPDGQPNGTEIMIWINHAGSVTPAGSYKYSVNINGMNWNVYTAPTGTAGFNSVWNVVSYVAANPVNQVNFDLKPFFDDTTAHGLLQTNWYLIDVEAGTEAWQNNLGFSSNSFSVSFSKGGGGGGIDPNAWYSVVNKNSGSCVDDAGFGTNNGSVVQQWSCNTNGQANQRWKFTPTDSGYYSIATQQAPSLAIDVSNWGTTNGSLLQLWNYGGGSNQQWMPVSLGGNSYKLVGRGSGKCLDVPAASTANGLQLQIYDCNGTAAQSFSLIAR